LWSDDPAPTDLLSFDAVAATVADALLDRALDPVALGLSGAWGSGKTTVLGLVKGELGARASEGHKILVIETEPWRYDPMTGAKETLIGEVLAALSEEIENSESTAEGVKEKAKRIAVRLAKRIDWAKAIKLTAKTSLAFQIPSVNDIVDLVKPAEDGGDDDQVRGLEAFRAEFHELMASEALGHIQAVAVLVDDLDRCLPETVIETLEAIRLFLAVPKMSFVIAADEDRVADAIRTRFGDTGVAAESSREDEEPAKLYLHKIVQEVVRVLVEV
jgi:predicted KAP-like P-loop ATPase